MNISNRMRAWSVVGAACAVFSPVGTIIQAEEIPVAADTDGCRAEVWRVVVPSMGGNPRFTPPPRIEVRSVLVCDDTTFVELQQRAGNDR